MLLTKGALRMLLNKYRLILGKCRLVNFLALTSITCLCAGFPALASASELHEDFRVSAITDYLGFIDAKNISIENGAKISVTGTVTASGDLSVDASQFTAKNVHVSNQATFTADSAIEIGNSFNSGHLDLDYSYAYLGMDVDAAGGHLGDVFIHKSFLILPDGNWTAGTMNADCGNLSVGMTLDTAKFIAGGAGITLGMDARSKGGSLGDVAVRGGSLAIRNGDWSAENVTATNGKLTVAKNFAVNGNFAIAGATVQLGAGDSADVGGNLGNLIVSSGSATILNGKNWLANSISISGGALDLLGENTTLEVLRPADGQPNFTYTGGALTVAEESGLRADYRSLGITLTPQKGDIAKLEFSADSKWLRQAVINSGGLMEITGFDNIKVSLDSYTELVTALAYVSDGGELSLNGLEPVVPPVEPDKPSLPDQPDSIVPDQPGGEQPDTPNQPGVNEPSVPEGPGVEQPVVPDHPGVDVPAVPDKPDGELPLPPVAEGDILQNQLIPGVVPYYPDKTLKDVVTVLEGGTFMNIVTGANSQLAEIGGTPVTRTTTLLGGPRGTIVIGTSDNRPQDARVLAGNTLNLGSRTTGNCGNLKNLTLEGNSNLVISGNGSGQWTMENLDASETGKASVAISGATLNASSIGNTCPFARLAAENAKVEAIERIQAESAYLDMALFEAGSLNLGTVENGATGTLIANKGPLELGRIVEAGNLSVNSATDIVIGDARVSGHATNGGGPAIQASGGRLTLSAQNNILGGEIAASSVLAGNAIGVSGSLTVHSEEESAALGAKLITVGQNLTVTNGNVTTNMLTVARNAVFNGCALTLGGQGEQGSRIGGNLYASNLRGVDGAVNLGDFTVDGAAVISTVTPVDINAANLSFGTKPTDASAITGGGNLNVSGTLKIGGSLTLGSTSDPNAVNLNASTVDLTNGRLVLDPAFSSNGFGNTGFAQIGALRNGLANIDVLQNYMASIGAPNASWLPERIAAGGFVFGQDISRPGIINAALGLWSPVIIPAGGAMMVDGAHWDVSDRAVLSGADRNNVHFGPGSLLVINGNAAGIAYTGSRTTALAGMISAQDGTTMSVSGGEGKLLISGVRPNTTYVILGKGMRVQDAGALNIWSDLFGDNPIARLLTVNPSLVDGQLQVDAQLISSAEFFPRLDKELVNAIDRAMLAEQVHPYFANQVLPRGAQFLSNALSAALSGNGASAGETLESMARILTAGSVPQMTRAASSAAAAASAARLSLAETGSLLQERKASESGTALWVMPIFQSVNGFGMEAGNLDYDFSGRIGGVALGVDHLFSDIIRAGMLFNIGGGYARGTADFNATDNNMNFWGLGIYAGLNKKNFGLMADLNFSSAYNKLKQELPGWTAWSELKSDVAARALNMGIRGEYLFDTAYLDIIPHVGVRYMNLNVDDYDVTCHGEVLKGDATTMSTWTFPLGITFNKKFRLAKEWSVAPSLDLVVTPAAGDMQAKSKVRFTGTTEQAELDTTVMDSITYGGNAGIELGNGSMTLSVNYSGQFGAHSSSHGVYGMFRYEF